MGEKKPSWILNRRELLELVPLSVAGSILAPRAPADELPPYRDAKLPIQERVADLLSRMTLEEKVAQTKCPGYLERALRDDQGNFSEKKAKELTKDGLGGILVISEFTYKPVKLAESARFINAFQKFLREQTPSGIPAIVVGEGLHGFMGRDATSFPQAIALASTWDLDLVHEVFSVTAAEARAREASFQHAAVGRRPRSSLGPH